MKIKDFGLGKRPPKLHWFAVKEAVLPFNRFAGVDPILGPEMKSTGEVMGIDSAFELAYWKSQMAAGQVLPKQGLAFLSAADKDKSWIGEIAWELADLGFQIAATAGTAAALKTAGVESRVLKKLAEKQSPNVLDLMRDNQICLLVNTPSDSRARLDEVSIRSEAILRSIPIVTTEAGARATVAAIRYMADHPWNVRALQDYYTKSSVVLLAQFPDDRDQRQEQRNDDRADDQGQEDDEDRFDDRGHAGNRVVHFVVVVVGDLHQHLRQFAGLLAHLDHADDHRRKCAGRLDAAAPCFHLP